MPKMIASSAPHGAHQQSIFTKGNTSCDLVNSFTSADGTGRDGFVFHTQNYHRNKYCEPLTPFHRGFDTMILTAPVSHPQLCRVRTESLVCFRRLNVRLLARWPCLEYRHT